jgi:hypothetical protein
MRLNDRENFKIHPDNPAAVSGFTTRLITIKHSLPDFPPDRLCPENSSLTG